MLTERQKQNASRELSEVMTVPGWKRHEIAFPMNGEYGLIEIYTDRCTRYFWVWPNGKQWELVQYDAWRGPKFRTFVGAVKRAVDCVKRDDMLREYAATS